MRHNRKIIYLAGFLFSLPIALMLYINSSFLSLFVGEKLMGMTYAIGSTLSIVTLLLTPAIFRRLGGYKFLLSVIVLDILSILLFAFSKNAFLAALIFILGLNLNALIVFTLDELLKIFSVDSETGRIRGTYLAVCHLALISGQLALGTVLGNFSFKEIYIIASIIMGLFFALTFFYLGNIPDPKYDKLNPIKFIKKYFKNKNLFRVYGISFLLQIFYCWMIIYTPIYLSAHLGFSWKEIGIIFTIMLAPFLFIPFNVGKYADKIGERRILMFGFLVAGISTLSLFLIKEHSIFIWATVLFITRIGAAIIESMTDAYFFKHIKPENEEFIGVYRSASPVAYIVGPLIAFIVFIFIPTFSFIYLILGALMLFGTYLASTIKKSDV